MKLYLSPGACSLADHIALQEAGVDFQTVKVDLKTHRTEDGRDYREINPKGYVPALAFDDGQVLTENVAILSWASDRGSLPEPQGAMGSFRLLEMLTFISTELHKQFKPFFSDAPQADKAKAGETIGKRLDYLATRLGGDYLFGPEFGVADAYLYVMLMWAEKNRLPIPQALQAFKTRMDSQPAVKHALEEEGLNQPELALS